MFQGQALIFKSEDFIGVHFTIEVEIDELKCNTYVSLLTKAWKLNNRKLVKTINIRLTFRDYVDKQIGKQK